jgi:selenocysteine lyase/cysteine desulfurase
MPSLPTLAEAEAAFRRQTPAFATTSHLDALRATEYARLDSLGHIYLDYTGAGLAAESQTRAHLELLNSHVFGNPHSTNPTSLCSTAQVEETRAAILAFFHASPDEYVVIFTPNASGALKLVGESYPFQTGDQYLLSVDNHNSVNGIREYARAAGAQVTYTPVLPPDLRLDAERLSSHLRAVGLQRPQRRTLFAPRRPAQAQPHKLFAYPAQSNFSGVQHALDWIPLAQEQGWDVLLDAAAFVPSTPLDLSRWRPDFVPVSFYKLFGYPTGIGCLIARKQALAKLRRPWFSGGTISVASVQGERHYLHEGPEGFEDGTLNYLALPAVTIGLRHLQAIGMDLIHTRVTCLTAWLLRQLSALTHASGAPLVRIYGPLTGERRGGAVALNVYDRDGACVDYQVVERRANQARISLRTGCFCNPGAGEAALGIEAEDLTPCLVRHAERLPMEEFRRCMDIQAHATGAVRLSLGLVSTFADVYACLAFAHTFLDKTVRQLVEEAKPAA